MERNQNKSEKILPRIPEDLQRLKGTEKFLKTIMEKNGQKEHHAHIRAALFYGAVVEGIPDLLFVEYQEHKNHIRIYELQITPELQGKGIGSEILQYLISKGRHKITLRTSKTGDALKFWQKHGAKVIGENEEDFEMEITTKNKPKPNDNYSSPRWTGEIADCSLPVTFDTYSNCSFGCVYCFSQYQRGIGKTKETYFAKQVKSVSVEKVKRIFTSPENNQFWEYIKDRRPIQWGGLSDQFDGYEKTYGVTYEILKFLREINYPICFSTKSAWVFFDDKYRELFKGADNWNMKFSIITMNEEKARKIEVGVPTPSERLRAMEEYSKLSKGGSTLRLRPFIIGVSTDGYIDLIKAASSAGANAMTTEFFCMEQRAKNQATEHYKIISECCGFDIVDFYKRYSNGTGYLRLNRAIKKPYIEKMKETAHDCGMRFYVSDAHWKELSDNGCCCALPPDWNYSRGNFSYALQIAKRKGECSWDDIEKDMYFINTFEWRNANGFNCNSSEARAKYDGMTMKDYLRYLWNNPKKGQSPYTMFGGVMKPDHLDKNGNIVYKYDESKTIQPCTHNCENCTANGFYDTLEE